MMCISFKTFDGEGGREHKKLCDLFYRCFEGEDCAPQGLFLFAMHICICVSIFCFNWLNVLFTSRLTIYAVWDHFLWLCDYM